MRRHGANGVAGTGQVDVDGVVPVGVLPFQDRLERLDAGIGEQDVEPAKSGARLFRRRMQGGEIALIEACFALARAGGLDQTPRLCQFVGRRRYDLNRRANGPCDIDAHYGGPLAGKGDGYSTPDPTSDASDNGSLAQQPS
jgi:hypothetical protein